jgi:hypothetical protein
MGARGRKIAAMAAVTTAAPGTAKWNFAISGDFVSERQDLNLRPPGPQPHQSTLIRCVRA